MKEAIAHYFGSTICARDDWSASLEPRNLRCSLLLTFLFIFILLSLIMLAFAFCHACMTTHSMDFLCFSLSLLFYASILVKDSSQRGTLTVTNKFQPSFSPFTFQNSVSKSIMNKPKHL